MRAAVLLPMIALAGMAQAQVVQSGFETWTGGTPDGWMGAASNILASSVTQVTDNVHGGTSAVRLNNTASGHKRFTTQPVNVTYGHTYEFRFWVRGAGDLRVGLKDGRADGFGYAYGDYSPATATWTEVVATIFGGNDATDAEFIFSVRSTVAPEHIVIDDVTITDLGPTPVTSIHEIQFTSQANGDSPLNGQQVYTGGIVTGVIVSDTDTAFFIQNNSGPWEGVYVFGYDLGLPELGDSMVFVATVNEFNGLTELQYPEAPRTVSTGNAGPAPLVVNTGDVALEALESVLVRVENGNCIEPPSGATFGKYKLDDGSGPATVGKLIYTTTPSPTLGTHYNVNGVNYYTFGEYNILPRIPSDVEISTSIAEAGILAGSSLFPNPATDLVTLDLGQAAGQRVNYTLSDAQGRVVTAGLVSDLRSTLSLNGLAAGAYNLTLTTNTFRKNIAVSVVR